MKPEPPGRQLVLDTTTSDTTTLISRQASTMKTHSSSARTLSDQPTTPTLKPAIDIRISPHLDSDNWGGRFLAAFCLIPGFPLMLGLMAMVKLTSRGPALYAQNRVGREGHIFTMYKLRSMVQNAEAGIGPTWSGRQDPRVTWFGRFLRASHLDELPQLLNVVWGEMAIFGPRPERPELIDQLAEQIPGYWNRLAVLPGITGLAQINLPPDETVDCVRKKLQLDLEYIEHANWWLDERMFVWTLLRLVMVPAGIATGLMGLARVVDLAGTSSTEIPALAPQLAGPHLEHLPASADEESEVETEGVESAVLGLRN